MHYAMLLSIFIAMFTNLIFIEIIGALEISSPTEVSVVPTVNAIQPRLIMSGATTDVTFNEPQPVANFSVDDVPTRTEATCTPPSSNEGTYIHTASR